MHRTTAAVDERWLFYDGGCSSDSSQHDQGSRFPGRRCPRVEQFTVVCHIGVVTVDFQMTFEDVIVCDLVLMALLTLLFLALSIPNMSPFYVLLFLQFLD